MPIASKGVGFWLAVAGIHQIDGRNAEFVGVDMVVQNMNGGVVLDDVAARQTATVGGAVYHAEVAAEFFHAHLERLVPGRNVVKLQISITNHVQQDKCMR